VVLRDALRGFLRDSGLDARLRNARVYQAWNDALGPRLARRIMPVQFRFGELTLEAESSVHLHELQSFTGESYRQDANRRLGEERIRKLNFRLKR
jgi:hypothetical protein